MFNADNYHWTQDECTEEGMKILSTYLQETHGVAVTDQQSAIYRAQRMGKQKIMYDLNLVLTYQGADYPVEYTALSKEDDLEIASGQLKELFIEAVAFLKDQLARATPSAGGAGARKAAPAAVPAAGPLKRAETESYQRTFTIKAPREQVKEFLLQPRMVALWSGGAIQVVEEPLSYLHPALSLHRLSEAAPWTITAQGNFAASSKNRPAGPGEDSSEQCFSLVVKLSEAEGETKLAVSSKNLPLNSADRFAFIWSSVYLGPIAQSLRVAFG